MTSVSPEVRRGIEDCLSCYQVCNQTIDLCLEMGGRYSEPAHQRTIRDCAEICSLAVSFMIRRSALSQELCALCAEACWRCAASCEAIAAGIECLLSCAETCRRCASSCVNMAGAGRMAA